LDGVVVSVDDAEFTDPIVNVAVQGPTPMRNVSNGPQMVDEQCCILDTAYVGFFTSEFRMFTGRQMRNNEVTGVRSPMWKLGKIMDTNIVRREQILLTTRPYPSAPQTPTRPLVIFSSKMIAGLNTTNDNVITWSEFQKYSQLRA
jgi:hypothetical protein